MSSESSADPLSPLMDDIDNHAEVFDVSGIEYVRRKVAEDNIRKAFEEGYRRGKEIAW